MDERLEYLKEIVADAIDNKMDSTENMLNLILQIAQSNESKLGGIGQDVNVIKNETKDINQKIDRMLQKLNDLENEFIERKKETRDIDQKLMLLANKLDGIEKGIPEKNLSCYDKLCKSIYVNWDKLDDLTKKLIPVAEYLFSTLQAYSKPDFSPVILELCRGIEAEFLLKIFSKYTLDLLDRKGNDLDSFLAIDRGSGYLQKQTGIFVKAITKASHSGEPEYTLGQMNTIMSKMNNRRAVRSSPLLQDFKNYLDHNTVANNLLNNQYISKIDALVQQYRNPSAHPGFMTVDKAQECKDLMPDRLDYLMDCLPMT